MTKKVDNTAPRQGRSVRCRWDPGGYLRCYKTGSRGASSRCWSRQLLLARQAYAGNEANFVLYDHHTDDKGETEVNVFGDFSNAVGDEPSYSAQLFEIEHALTDRWEAALYLEGDKINGDEYQFGGWRLESRYRLFKYSASFFNPVLYVDPEPQSRSQILLDVTGRTDTSEGPAKWEHEVETS